MNEQAFITHPLTQAEIKERTVDGELTVVFGIDLYELACVSQDGTIDGLNDWVDTLVYAPLSDLRYRLVGTDGQLVLIELRADVEEG